MLRPGRACGRRGRSVALAARPGRRRLHRARASTSRASTTSCSSAATPTPRSCDVLQGPGGHGGAALRAADRAEPQARARLALDPRPAARQGAGARRSRTCRGADLRHGVALYVTTRFAIFKHAFTNPVDPTSIQVPPPGWRRIATERVRRRLCPLLSRPAAMAVRAWPLAAVAGRRRSRCACGASARACRSSTTPTRTRTSSRARSGCSATPTTRTTSSTRPPSRTCCTWRSRSASAAATASRPAFAADPATVFAVARALSAVLGAVAVGLLAWAGARLFDRRVGLVAARAARGRLPARPLRRTSRSTTSRRCARLPRAGRHRRRLPRGRCGDYALAGRRPRPRLRDQVHGRDRAAAAARRGARRPGQPTAPGLAGSCSRACSRWRSSWSPTRTRCSTSTRSATGSASSRRRRATAAASSG